MRPLLLFPAAALGLAAQALPGPGGHWIGGIQLPTGDLGVRLTLEAGMPWRGSLSIPLQGLKDFPLQVEVKGASFTLRMAGIPGDPCFQGTRVQDGLEGTFTQGGKAFPFRFTQAAPETAPRLPAGLSERELKVGRAPWELPGTLTLPAGKGPFPALVLVHGSGPQDRDERIGDSTPFRDLAWGLAQRGVAVLRYDKRTKVHGAACLALLKSLTVREETVEDAALAAGLAAAQPEVSPSRVFLLGHSLGGYLLPRLAKAAPGCAGFISLAGCARPLEDLILEQLRAKPLPPQALATVEAGVRRVKALQPGEAASGEPLLGVPAAYWLDLKGFDPAREALGIARPMLFLQGDRDCQVPLLDFEIWRKALGGRRDVRFRRYGDLNHLFMPVEGVSTGAEYERPGQHVSSQVMDDLADWVRSSPAYGRTDGAPKP